MKLKESIKYLPAAVFCLFIAVFAVLFFVLPKSDFSELEKRKLAEFPELSLTTLADGSFQKSLDTYLSDHMPARNFFVGLDAAYDLASGRNGENGIYLGSDNYLVPKPSEQSELLDKNAGFIKEYADLSDCPVYATLIPSSGFVNADKLPLLHAQYRDDELISGFTKKLGDNVTFIDVVKTLQEKADSEHLYYRTDHHWTALGAYECYRALGDKMGYKPLEKDSFSVETHDGFYGTSYAKAALWTLAPDSLELWSDKSMTPGSVSVEIADGKDKKTSDSYFFPDQLQNDDKYPVYLDGNHALETITNSQATGGTLVVVKDSYAHTIVPFLSRHYKKIIMADLRYYKNDISAITEKENAEGVLILYSLDNMSTDNNLANLF